jgi:hypothetical protein
MEGQFKIAGLPPGQYELVARATSFATVVQNIVLDVGDDKTINVILRLGHVGETIAVTGEMSQLNLTSSQIEGSVRRLQVQNLPLNGRNFLELARLEPGVSVVSVPNPGGSGNTYQRVSIPGAKYSQTRISVDGATTNERLLGGTLINFSQETVQEFQTASFNLDPATSTTGAGAINVVSRRGENNVHGSGFFFFRDHHLAAYPGLHRNPANPDPFFARRQAGFEIGGPLRPNRVFWFFNYEHNNQDGVFDVVNNNPIFQKLNLIHPSPLNSDLGNLRFDAIINAKNSAFLRVSIDRNNTIAPPAAGNFMPSNWQASGSAGTQVAGGLTSVVTPSAINDLRLSYTVLNSSLKPMSTAQCQNPLSCLGVGGPEIQVFDAPSFRIGNQQNVPFSRYPRTFQISDNATQQHGSHTFRFGSDWEHLVIRAVMDLSDPAVITLWGPSNLRQFPSLFNSLPASLRDAGGPLPTLAEILQLPLRNFTMGVGDPTLPGPFHNAKASHDDELRFYFQDAWKIASGLEVTYGLAYSLHTQLFNDDLSRPAYLAPLLGGNLHPPQSQRDALDPSVGFVWNLGTNRKAVLRAGTGIYHDEINFLGKLQERTTLGPSGGRVAVDGSLVGLSFLSTPTSFNGSQLVSMLPGLTATLTSQLGDGSDPSVRGVQVLKQGSFIFDPNQTTPYAFHVNAGVERTFGSSWIVSADYVMRRYLHGSGLQLFQFGYQSDQNRFNRPIVTGVDPTTGAVSFVRNPIIPLCSPAQAAALNPNDQCSTGPINFWQSGLSYRYQALQVRLDKRFSSHFQLQVSYALAKNTGFLAVTNADDASQNYGNAGPGIGGDLTPSPRHMLIANGVFVPPLYRGSSGLLRALFNNWSIAVVSEADSRPALDTLLVGLDLDGDGISNTLLPGTTRHNTFGEGLSAAGLRALVAQFNAKIEAHSQHVHNPDGTVTTIRPRTPFNQIINPITLPDHFSSGDSFISQDLRLSRRIAIGEKTRLFLLGEVFNAFNVANVTGYSNVLNSLSYGQPSVRVGQVFGSGGPRAFQLGARIEF